MQFAPLAQATRGGRIESLHLGAVAVVNLRGELLYQAGDAQFLTFTRSTLKPFQAVPLVHAGGLEQFGFTLPQTALLCASHSGEARHVALVQAMLEQIGCDESHLRCGCHVPICAAGSSQAAGAGDSYSQLHNNCSGKHAGFLAYCRQHGLPLEDYLDPAHPLQQAVRDSVAHFFSVAAADLAPGIDGCSAPNYALPLSRLAHAYARLAQDRPDARYGDTLQRLFQAMTTHPDLVSGTGRFDLALMQAAPGDWVAKGGAEGVQAIGLRAAGLGIAIKVADGNARAVYPATISVLAQLGVMDSAQAAALAHWAQPQLTNLRGVPTGEVRATLDLVKI